ncbi:MAG: hypothetical protein ABR498_04780 [Candidatus Dormibacteria bacterium]
MPPQRSRLTLGALHRTLTQLIAPGPGRSVSVHFEQRSATAHESDRIDSPDLFVTRRFDARLAIDRGAVVDADLRSSGMARHSHAWISIVDAPDGYRYTTDVVHFGRLGGRLELFDVARFQRRLDGIPVDDVIVDDVNDNGHSVVVLDMEVEQQRFARLISMFAAADADHGDDLDLRSFSLSLSASDDVSLDYWWSLAGAEPVDGEAYRHTVACHVRVSVKPEPVARPEPPRLDASLPELHHIDDVWALARQTTSATAS